MAEKAEKNANNSWNPLSYSQNLCVVSNASGSADNELKHSLDETFVDTFSAIDIQNETNRGINRFVNDLIANNGNELGLDCIKSFQKFNSNSSESSHALTGDHINTNNVFNANQMLSSGDFALNCGNKSHATALLANGLTGMNGVTPLSCLSSLSSLPAPASAFNINSLPFVPKPDLMSKRYAEMQSFPQQIRSSNTSQLMNSLSHPMSTALTNSLSIPLSDSMSTQTNTSLSSAMIRPTNGSQLSVMQSMVGSKSLAFSQNQTYQQFVPQMDGTIGSVQTINKPVNRQMRSIRARNTSQNPIEPMNRLNYYLDKSHEQFKHLEKERKKVEFELIQAFVGQKISSANNIPIQRLPQNATKIDKITTDMSREHAKVITIVAKMEQLKGRELNESIHNSIQKWVEIIRDLQMKRKYELQKNTTNIAAIGSPPEESFIHQICDILKQLSACIRSVRSALWSASVLTLYDKQYFA